MTTNKEKKDIPLPRSEIGTLLFLLEYMEEREDVRDGSYGEPVANEEMNFAEQLREMLQRRNEI